MTGGNSIIKGHCRAQHPIDPDSLEVLPTEHQRVEDRRADLVVKLREHDGEPFVLHMEIQNDNGPAMPVRMMLQGKRTYFAKLGCGLGRAN